MSTAIFRRINCRAFARLLFLMSNLSKARLFEWSEKNSYERRARGVFVFIFVKKKRSVWQRRRVHVSKCQNEKFETEKKCDLNIMLEVFMWEYKTFRFRKHRCALIKWWLIVLFMCFLIWMWVNWDFWIFIMIFFIVWF